MILAAIHFLSGARIHGLPNITMIDLRDPGRHSLDGWSAYVRGPAVFIISPPGWKYGVSKDGWIGTSREMFEVPRDKVCLQWAGVVGDIESVGKWSPPVTDDEELEQLTAPRGAKGR